MADIQFQEELTQYLSKIRGLMPVGTPWWGFDIKSKPRGVQLYLGQTLNRVMYPVHFEYIQTYRTIVTEEEWKAYAETHNGLCPYFSYGDNQYTYRMPRIVDVHARFGNCIEEAGKYLEAGIPNITGHVRAYSSYNKNNASFATNGVSGAFYWDTIWDNDTSKVFASSTNLAAGTADTVRNIPFDASRCSSVYKNGIDTVQPPAINMIIGEYVTSGVSTIDVITSENILTNIELLEEKVANVEDFRDEISHFIDESELEKYNTSYVIEHWSEGTQWYRKWSNGWIEQGGYCDAEAVVTTTITLHIPYTNTNYSVHLTNLFANSATKNPVHVTTQTTSTFTYWCENTNGNAFWYACGF